MADNILKKVSEDEILQQLREDREMGQMIMRVEKRAAREKALAEGLAEGRAEGLAEGRAEGRAEEKKDIARKLKSMGISSEQITKATGLTEIEIEEL